VHGPLGQQAQDGDADVTAPARSAPAAMSAVRSATAAGPEAETGTEARAKTGTKAAAGTKARTETAAAVFAQVLAHLAAQLVAGVPVGRAVPGSEAEGGGPVVRAAWGVERGVHTRISFLGGGADALSIL